jgi:hypothetical protein
MSNKLSQQLDTIWKYTKFIFKNIRAFRASRQLYEVRTNLSLANMEIGKMTYHDPIYAQRVKEFNQVMVELIRGKWLAACAMEAKNTNEAKENWQRASAKIRISKEYSQRLLETLQAKSQEPLNLPETALSASGTEILFAEGAPLVPEINPIVILQGSDFEMGYQYAQQLVQIYGKWILERKTGKQFTPEELDCLRKWEAQLKIHAPEILRMCEGWRAGAQALGIAMSYEDVVDIWTGHRPPAQTYLGLGDGEPFMAPPYCSGAAAWGKATTDGKLVTVSTGDHDCHHMATIIAFPETGNNFIITPFGATGDVPKLGGIYMFGHPGMNNQGLAYVEHGGMPKMVEPKKDWGYGIRMGAAVFHILRFANSAREAQQMELSLPVGDVGSGGFGSLGGFWADSEYGYIIDSRKDPIVIHEAGDCGETDFLYAANHPLHRESGQAPWMQADKDAWHYDAHGGWYADYRPIKKIGIDEEVIIQSLGNGFIGSRHRSLYLFNILDRAVGKIDFEYMKMVNRQGCTLPAETWKESVAHFKKTGQWTNVTTGHASNADVVVTKPDHGDQGLYALCVGTAKRGLAPCMPTWCSPIFNETNAYWEVQLASSPEEVTKCARQKASEYIDQACSLFTDLDPHDPAYKPLESILAIAEEEFNLGNLVEAADNIEASHWAKATRAYTRAQVRALQVTQALHTAPDKPEDFDVELLG